MNKKISLLLILLICLVACIENTEKKESNELNCQGTKTFFVSRVIDGDTLETPEGKIRLIAINTPEKKETCFEEAKEFLEKEILGREIEVKTDGKDIYERLLGNICINEESLNKKLVEQGLAHYAFGAPTELIELQEKAMKENKGCLWKKGTEKYVLDNCITLSGFEFNQNSFTGEFAEFSNDCNYSIDLNGFYLKDEATHLYFFPEIELKEKSFIRVFSAAGEDTMNELYWNKGNVWNDSGDQLFLRNKKGELIVYYHYLNLK